MGSHTAIAIVVLLSVVHSVHCHRKVSSGCAVTTDSNASATTEAPKYEAPSRDPQAVCSIDLTQMFAELSEAQKFGGGKKLDENLGKQKLSHKCDAEAVTDITKACEAGEQLADRGGKVQECVTSTLDDRDALYEIIHEVEMAWEESQRMEGTRMDTKWAEQGGTFWNTYWDKKEFVKEGRLEFCSSCCEYKENRVLNGEVDELGRDELSVKVQGRTWLGIINRFQHDMVCEGSGGTHFKLSDAHPQQTCNLHWTLGKTARISDCEVYCETSCGTGKGRKAVYLPGQKMTRGQFATYADWAVYECESNRGGYIGGTVSGPSEYCLYKVHGIRYFWGEKIKDPDAYTPAHARAAPKIVEKQSPKYLPAHARSAPRPAGVPPQSSGWW